MKGRKDLVFGIHPVAEAVYSGKVIDKVLVKKGLAGAGLHGLIRTLRKSDVNIQYVPEEKLNRLTSGNHQGIVAFISEIEFYRLEEIVPLAYERGRSPLITVLDGITDVRNFGAIARTAECAGVDALLVPTKSSASVTPDAIRTSAGALYKIPVCRTGDMPASLKFLRDSGLQLLCATEKAEASYFNTDLTVPCAFVLGAEDKGISPGIIKIADKLISIPMYGTIRSLNVSVAASLIMYEAVRQREFKSKSQK